MNFNRHIFFVNFVLLFNFIYTFIFAAEFSFAQSNHINKIKVITTTPDLKWMVEKIGGTEVEVESLLTGVEDPHFVDAMPHFIAKVKSAQMFCLVGMDLEVAWVPKILTKAGNKDLLPGGKGYCEAGKTVKALSIPSGSINRSHGDLHPQGNPHYHLGPEAFLQAGETILATLTTIAPAKSVYFEEQFEQVKKELNTLKLTIKKMLSPLLKIKGAEMMEYHREFTYFLHEYGPFKSSSVEEIPGVPPSAGRLARVSLSMQAKDNKVEKKVLVVLASTTSPRDVLHKLQEMSGVPVVYLPVSLVTNHHSKDLPKDYKEHQMMIASEILKAIKK